MVCVILFYFFLFRKFIWAKTNLDGPKMDWSVQGFESRNQIFSVLPDFWAVSSLSGSGCHRPALTPWPNRGVEPAAADVPPRAADAAAAGGPAVEQGAVRVRLRSCALEWGGVMCGMSNDN